MSREDACRLIGIPRPGGILIVSDHASARVPADITLGIAPDLLSTHIAIDLGVAEVAELMVARAGCAAFLGDVSRLVCDFNREEHAPTVVPLASDGHAIPGNALDHAGHQARLARFFHPYHTALARLLREAEPALILSLHSFTPRLASHPGEARPWQVGVLYNLDDRAARLAIPLLEAEELIVGDQQPYSGRLLNATMNTHAEGAPVQGGRAYLGIEIRQDQIASPGGQAVWAERLGRVCAAVVAGLG